VGAEVVDLACVRLRRGVRARTARQAFGPTREPLDAFMGLGFDEESALHLQGRHSATEVRSVLELPAARERIEEGIPHVWADVELALREEMAVTLDDMLVRRLSLFYEAPDQGLAAAPRVADRMGGGGGRGGFGGGGAGGAR